MTWKVGQPKQQLSEVLRRAEKEPQILQKGDRVVGAVIGAEDVEQADMFIAATAHARGLDLATRNVRHFDGCGLRVVNPFD